MRLGINPIKPDYYRCSLINYKTGGIIEEHHFVCACGDCACHVWDGNHYGIQYRCSCHYWSYKERKWELREKMNEN